MSYLVLARKYRPQSFEDLVGQEHVQKTLASAIETGRVAHAFLFTGVRGVGKTTSARLLAKCLNCLGPDGAAKGPAKTPCQVCAACTEIAQGNDMDVQEIDGASYNGVDEVRRLQEGLAFRPARDRYKIFIVDEVHMLSTAAWNAFLKTLEEPPPHVKFIFATTEVHKVPITILSRCQRYDFKLIASTVIGQRLREVLVKENLTADDGAVAVLAREAAGSMRDAMSLLDQVIAYGGATLNEADVARVLGVADRRVLHDLGNFLLNGDAAGALRTVDAVAAQGFDLVHVCKDMLAHLRNLVVAKVTGEGARELLDLADDEVKDVLAAAASRDADDLLRVYQGFSRSFDEIARSGQVRAALEMTLVRLARRPALVPLDELLSRLGDLERRLAGAPTPPRGGGGGARTHASISQAVNPITGGTSEGTENVFSSEMPRSQSVGSTVPRAQAAAAPVTKPEEATPLPPSATRKPATVTPISAARSARQESPSSVVFGPIDLDAWRAIVERVRSSRPALASILEQGTPMQVSSSLVRVGYADGNFLGGTATEPDALNVLLREARAHFDGATEVHVHGVIKGLTGDTLASIAGQRRREVTAAQRAAVESHPIVKTAMTLFDAELREVKLVSEE